MNEIQFSIRVSQGESGRTFIMALGQTPDEFGLLKTKTGFLEVQPAKAEEVLSKFQSGELKVRFGALIPRTQNQYAISYYKADEQAVTEGVQAVNTAVEHS